MGELILVTFAAALAEWEIFKARLPKWSPDRYTRLGGKPWQPAMAQGSELDSFSLFVIAGGLGRLHQIARGGKWSDELQSEFRARWAGPSTSGYNPWSGTDHEDELRNMMGEIEQAAGNIDGAIEDWKLALMLGHGESMGARAAYINLRREGVTEAELVELIGH